MTQQMPSPPNAPQDLAVRQTVDALERKGNRWPSRRIKCKVFCDRDKTARVDRFITFTAELQTRRTEQFDGLEIHEVDVEQIIRVHDVVIPEAPETVKAAGETEAKCWHRDQFVNLLRTVIGRERIPAGIEIVEEVSPPRQPASAETRRGK